MGKAKPGHRSRAEAQHRKGAGTRWARQRHGTGMAWPKAAHRPAQAKMSWEEATEPSRWADRAYAKTSHRHRMGKKHLHGTGRAGLKQSRSRAQWSCQEPQRPGGEQPGHQQSTRAIRETAQARSPHKAQARQGQQGPQSSGGGAARTSAERQSKRRDTAGMEARQSAGREGPPEQWWWGEQAQPWQKHSHGTGRAKAQQRKRRCHWVGKAQPWHRRARAQAERRRGAGREDHEKVEGKRSPGKAKKEQMQNVLETCRASKLASGMKALNLPG